MSPMDPPQRRGPRLSGGAGDVVARPPEPKAWKVGSTVQGKYLLQELLDRGGSADVFRAENGFTHQAVAIKILHAHLVGIRGLAERMHQEAMLMARVKHPNHVLIYDGGIIDGVVFIVMELLEGRNLRRLLLAEGRLDVERALFIVSKAADGLIAAHNEGVTHRDMKPENTFLTYRNEVKLFDFGIAKYRKAIGPRLTDDGKSPGTIPYMSPEQLAGRMVDHRTDIFALSVILLELLLGHHPFASGPYEWPLNEEELKNRMRDWDVTSFRTLVPDLSDDVWAIIEKAGQRDPAARFRTMEEMKEAIHAAEHAACRHALLPMSFPSHVATLPASTCRWRSHPMKPRTRVANHCAHRIASPKLGQRVAWLSRTNKRRRNESSCSRAHRPPRPMSHRTLQCRNRAPPCSRRSSCRVRSCRTTSAERLLSGVLPRVPHLPSR